MLRRSHPVMHEPASAVSTRRYRTIWLSDINLGTRGCKAAVLPDFLRSTESDTRYLVGDIIDGWSLRRSWYWDQHHNDVFQKIMRKARKGTHVIYIPGNHDEFARDYVDHMFGGIAVRDQAIHELDDGRRLLVLHGDEFDGVIRYAKWLAVLGDLACQDALALNHWLNGIRRRPGHPYWSLSACLKRKVKNAVHFIDNHEHAIAREARLREIDGVVCGHIHKAQLLRDPAARAALSAEALEYAETWSAGKLVHQQVGLYASLADGQTTRDSKHRTPVTTGL